VKCEYQDLDGWQDVFMTELKASLSLLGYWSCNIGRVHSK